MIQQAETLAETVAGSWYVIWAETRAEKKVERRLATLGDGLKRAREATRFGAARWTAAACVG